jgi:hypothetical protein
MSAHPHQATLPTHHPIRTVNHCATTQSTHTLGTKCAVPQRIPRPPVDFLRLTSTRPKVALGFYPKAETNPIAQGDNMIRGNVTPRNVSCTTGLRRIWLRDKPHPRRGVLV